MMQDQSIKCEDEGWGELGGHLQYSGQRTRLWQEPLLNNQVRVVDPDAKVSFDAVFVSFFRVMEHIY